MTRISNSNPLPLPDRALLEPSCAASPDLIHPRQRKAGALEGGPMLWLDGVSSASVGAKMGTAGWSAFSPTMGNVGGGAAGNPRAKFTAITATAERHSVPENSGGRMGERSAMRVSRDWRANE
jgi:hypothetical protein